MKNSIIIDGPNFISRLIELNIDKDKIVQSLSLNSLYLSELREKLNQEFGNSITLGMEFICSKKHPGPQKNKLTKVQYETLLSRLRNENAVYINQLNISANNEKGVDIAVAIRCIEVSETCDVICLIASDKDYIPVLEYLRRKGKYIVTIGIEEKHPVELKNLSYLYIDLTDYFTNIFP